jgi:ribose transport system permease protein
MGCGRVGGHEAVTATAVVERFGTALAGLALAVFFLAFAPNFGSPTNLLNVAKDTSVLAILGLGFTLALTTAELDLSVADVASLAAVAAGWCIQAGHNPAIAVAAALFAGLGLGAVNGFGVTVLHVPSLIMTLGTAAIARGAAFMITQGVAFVGRWPASFTGLARATALGVPVLILWTAGATLFAHVLLGSTRTGAHMVATGEADEAARLAGIATAWMKRLGLALSGLLAGVAAILLAAGLSSAAPNMAGDYFLYAIAAVLLGMTMFQPGHPNALGTLVASLILKILGNGLVLMGAAYYTQDMVLGAVIISSVAFSATVVRKAAFKL